MATCHHCGDEIEFRFIDGKPKPIHVSGRWCPGYGSRGGSDKKAAGKAFKNAVSYVNPNAYCPECGQRVFFYQSPYGGRVFFDDLGWPWPKHGCTDNPRAQTAKVRTTSSVVVKTFRNRAGEVLDLYELASLKEAEDIMHMRFRRMNDHRSFKASIPIVALAGWDITPAEIRQAPSFVVHAYDTIRIVEFISARKKRIEKIIIMRNRAKP